MVCQMVAVDYPLDRVSLVMDLFVKFSLNMIDFTTLELRVVYPFKGPWVDVIDSKTLGIERYKGMMQQILWGEGDTLRVFGPV
jgi:hypothetical protein